MAEVKKTAAATDDQPTIYDTERAELLRLREACWESQKSSGKTGTCGFLDLLLKVHEALLTLDRLERGVTTPGNQLNPAELKEIRSLMQPVGKEHHK